MQGFSNCEQPSVEAEVCLRLLPPGIQIFRFVHIALYVRKGHCVASVALRTFPRKRARTRKAASTSALSAPEARLASRLANSELKTRLVGLGRPIAVPECEHGVCADGKVGRDP